MPAYDHTPRADLLSITIVVNKQIAKTRFCEFGKLITLTVDFVNYLIIKRFMVIDKKTP